jgi:HIV Tat-specific factor 1
VTGLPLDITEEELGTYFAKCGILRIDPHSGEKKIKIYENDGKRKGDALIQYAKEESVDLALEHLNDSEIRQGYKIRVERATFQQKGSEYQARKKKKTDKLELYRIKTEVERLFTWNEEEEEERGLRIVVLKGVFTPEEIGNAENKQQFLKEIEEDIRAECTEKLGEIDRLILYDVALHITHRLIRKEWCR